MSNRHISHIVASQPTTDGAGVAIQRLSLVGNAKVDPVLMIDELKSPFREDFAAGFPAHPHRGMQTLTYMKHGGIIHEDSLGNRGEIVDGGAQWMSAGRGVIHSEMPTQETQGLHGFQLWFNLPAAEKMDPPRYRDIPAAELASVATDRFSAVVIAGDWQLDDVELRGPLVELVPQASLMDLTLGPNSEVRVATASTDNALAYLYDGMLLRHGETIPAGHLLVAEAGDHWVLSAGAGGARLLVMTGRPLREPVVAYGPFVMNTKQQIQQAIDEYQSGRFLEP